ncbi:hypothetical protein MJH12_05620, partial [bacterium]|nr:hypothetical protein [bacterium]
CEWMNDTVDDQDPQLKSRLGQLGYDLMFQLLGELSKGSGSFIIEGCINPETSGQRILSLIEKSSHEIVEIIVFAEKEILLSRYAKRANSKDRHEAHGNESKRIEELSNHLDTVIYRPLRIGSHVFEINNGEHAHKTHEVALKLLQENGLLA